MPARFAVDNDVWIKLSRFGLLEEFGSLLGGGDQLALLGAARFVVPKRIARQVAEPTTMIAAFQVFTAGVAVLEPTEDERHLAGKLEEFASRNALDLDSGESQLAAMVISRLMEGLLTGDKRAVRALAELLKECQGMHVEYLAGRVACVEQVLLALVDELGVAPVRASVCAASAADRALAICFSCASDDPGEDSVREGLGSYINALRIEGEAVLATTFPPLVPRS